MTSRIARIMFAALLLTAGAGAQSLTWNGAADDNEWYAFNFVEDTWDPQVWVNNWGQVYYRYPADPEPQGLMTPGDTATIPLGYTADNRSLVQVTTIELDGILEVREQINCAQVNVAGNLRMDHHGYIDGCAIQGDGPAGFLSSIADVDATLSGPTLEDVTLSLPTEIGNGSRIGFAGVIANLGVIQILDAPGLGETRFTVDSDVTLAGPAWLETSDFPDNEINAYFNPRHRLTNQTEIHAAGRVGPNIGVTNEGLIVADRTTTLTVDPDDDPLDGQPGVVNTGTLRAEGGGTLRLERGTFDNAGGVIEALDGSVVELGRAAMLSGGELATAGTGVIRSVHGASNTTADPQVRDAVISGLVEIGDDRRLEIAGTVVLGGEIGLGSLGSTARLVVDSPTALTGGGEVVLSDDSHNQIAAYAVVGHRLTTGVTIRGAGELENIAVTNTGVIRAEGSSTLVVDPTGAPQDGGAPLENRGTLVAAPGATLRLYDGAFDNAGGVIEALDGGVVELHVDSSVTGGLVRSVGAGAVRSTTSWHPPTLADTTVEGWVEVPFDTQLRLGGTVVNDGLIEAVGNVLPSGELVLAGSGELRLVDGGEIRPDGIRVTNGGTHWITATGGSGCWLHQELVNHGVLAVAAGASLRMNATYEPRAGSVTVADGTLDPLGALGMAGTLAGAGAVSSPVSVLATGVLDPGSDAASSLSTGSLTVEDGATYLWDVALPAADLVDVGGTLDLGTAALTVTIRVVSGFVPDRVELFEFDSLAGTPDASQFVLTGGYTFTGVDTSGNRLALTGVEDTGLLFADGFESGDVSGWSAAVGSLKTARRLSPPAAWLRVRVDAPTSPHDGVPLVEGLAEDGERLVVVEAADGGARLGVRTADGWRWSGRRAADGRLELQWRDGAAWLYHALGLGDAVVGDGCGRDVATLVVNGDLVEIDSVP